MSATEDKTAAVQALLTIPELRRELGPVLNFNQSINGHQHIKDHEQSASYGTSNMVQDLYKRF